MKVGDVLSIQRFVDRELSRDWVDDKDTCGGLVSSGACDTVSEGPVFVVVRADLLMQRIVS